MHNVLCCKGDIESCSEENSNYQPSAICAAAMATLQSTR